jgi:hypothetical protein
MDPLDLEDLPAPLLEGPPDLENRAGRTEKPKLDDLLGADSGQSDDFVTAENSLRQGTVDLQGLSSVDRGEIGLDSGQAS